MSNQFSTGASPVGKLNRQPPSALPLTKTYRRLVPARRDRSGKHRRLVPARRDVPHSLREREDREQLRQLFYNKSFTALPSRAMTCVKPLKQTGHVLRSADGHIACPGVPRQLPTSTTAAAATDTQACQASQHQREGRRFGDGGEGKQTGPGKNKPRMDTNEHESDRRRL